MEMFRRKIPKVDSPEANALGQCSQVSIASQVDFGTRTVGIATDNAGMRTVGCHTDGVVQVDRESSTEIRDCWDAAVQHVAASMEVATDPGEWNETVVCGMDIQTDTPDTNDPLFWITGSTQEVNNTITGLLELLERDHFQAENSQFSCKEARDLLKLRADNVLLRIEVAELKRKLNAVPVVQTVASPFRTWTPIGTSPSVAGLTGGFPRSETFEVLAEGGLPVTSSLAPSSYKLGQLRKGDKVLTAGSPEEILGQVRGPILPRGWVTLRDKEKIYLTKC